MPNEYIFFTFLKLSFFFFSIFHIISIQREKKRKFFLRVASGIISRKAFLAILFDQSRISVIEPGSLETLQ